MWVLLLVWMNRFGGGRLVSVMWLLSRVLLICLGSR